MDHRKNYHAVPIALAVVMVLWIVIVMMFADFDRAGAYFWTGFVFGIVGFLIGIASICFFTKQAKSSVVETSVIPSAGAICYIALSTILNTIYVCIADGDHIKILILLNILLIAIYVIIELFAAKQVIRVNGQVATVQAMTKQTHNCSAKVGAILAIAKDDEVHKKLFALKEAVDYSSNTTKGYSSEMESQFIAQLNIVHEMIINEDDVANILEEIDKASNIWASRNAARP